jgi:hypothetical protein
MSDDLVTWLRAQLDDDERVARASWKGNGWRHENQPDEVWTGKQQPGHTPIPIAKAWNESTAEHIARHDPARVLAEVAAKRAIIGMISRRGEKGRTPFTAKVLVLLALPYADRPGYREEWRPRG